MSLTAEQYEILQPIASRIAGALRRRYPMTDRDDIEQECMLWAVQRPGKVREYLAEDEDHGRLARSMRNAAVRFCEAEKAARRGYDPDDLYYYSTRELGALLGVVFDKESWASPPNGDGEKIRGGDPAVGGNWLATLVDVDMAFSRLDYEDQEVLKLRYLAGGEDKTVLRELAESYDVSVSTVDRRIKRALRHLQDELGGPRPDEDREYTGSSRTIRNSQANAIIGSQT